ncbi:Hint domain-containing protein [Octadecabacter sp. G9-8]|uniref:Hint domain-containing protein n=1 Tax=Octadecabacter dasysiphoniae TaxID=2909341 RepID=A0ABS9CVC7_9RHOB|nr:Hint domain-containing protein [Octadecabacter dasysiphoniae]MCF2870789.1 Hint domain-containing protein [Octadecabacter dasysiphoniae]
MPDPYVSEMKYLGGATLDFVEVAVDAGTDVSDIFVTIYNPNGSVRTVNGLGSSVTTQYGKDIYVISTSTSGTFNGLNKSGGVALEQGGSLLSFSSFDDGAVVNATSGIASGQSSTQVGSAGAGSSLETLDGGATYTTQTSPTSGAIPCFCAGTLIETEDGPIPVEDLPVGIRLLAHDGAWHQLRLRMHRKIDARDLAKNPKLKPVRIRTGALGAGLPERDLWVSRQHRMLTRSPIAKRMFGDDEVLIAAIHLTGLRGVEIASEVSSIEYVHLLLDDHAIVLAEGAGTESLLVTQSSLAALGPDATREIADLFPLLLDAGAGMTPTCPIPKGAAQKQLVGRHAKNNKMICTPRAHV